MRKLDGQFIIQQIEERQIAKRDKKIELAAKIAIATFAVVTAIISALRFRGSR